MKTTLLFIITVLFAMNSFSQITFEKGYFISNNNEKTDCLIKNMDWDDNPLNFSYKLSGSEEVKIASIKNTKEFSIENGAKYIRKTINIDRSSEKIASLSETKKPIFKEETLFLKVLVAGKANLYSYKQEELRRFFYSVDEKNAEQLVFKSYVTKYDKVGKNNYFKQQLYNRLKCSSSVTLNTINKLRYVTKDLIRFFVDYNTCSSPTYTNDLKKEKQDLFNLTLRPRINNTSLSIENSIQNSNFLGDLNNTDFGNKTSIGFGVELEFILPYNKNKWAIVLEPTYQSFNASKVVTGVGIFDTSITLETKYSSVELPLSLRHYFFLNEKSKLFANISYVLDLNLNEPSIDIIRESGSDLPPLDIKSSGNFALGMGYKFNDKYSVEIRFNTNRNVLGKHTAWKSNYKNTSIILGYTLF